jgi:hypothetical protein
MLIQFKVDTELEVVESYDEATEEVDSSNETFKAGSQHDVEIVGDNGEAFDLQFGDGSVAFAVSKEIVQRVMLHDFAFTQENAETGDETLFFTVVNPYKPEQEDRVVFVQERTPHGPGPVHFALPNSLIVDNQQLAELGWLLIALAGKDVDYSSAAELLEGYGKPVPDALEKLCSG